MSAGAIILSGGKSSRMGTNKALLKISEKTNIERITDQLSNTFKDMILVTNEPDNYEFLNVKKTKDIYPGMGPLAGIHAGLNASKHEVNLIVACDMPFVSANLAADFVNLIGEYDAVIPVIFGKQHPLFSVIKKRVLNKIEESIINERLRMKHLLDCLNVLYVTENDLKNYSSESLNRIFFNMNHPNEYEDALKWAHQEGM